MELGLSKNPSGPGQTPVNESAGLSYKQTFVPIIAKGLMSMASRKQTLKIEILIYYKSVNSSYLSESKI